MYVSPSSIVPATGALSSIESRRSQAFGRVVEGFSDARSVSSQMLFTFRPDVGKTLSGFLRDPLVSYVLSDSRALQRGFSGNTFGDPGTREWAAGDLLARHQFVFQTVYWPLGSSRPSPGIFFYGHLQSGLPFTPMVGNDVNGDGLANDRAFIFDPARAADPALAAQMRSLLASSPANVRDCLASQLGQAAARNSCRGPWTATLNVNIVWPTQWQPSSMEKWRLGLNFANALGGIDQLLHGSNNLQGWGTTPTPDPVLYSVKGFDPATNRFQYAVNPRFGTTAPALTTVRAPFRVTLDANIDIGPSLPRQQTERWLTAGRDGHPGPKLTERDMLLRLQRTIPDPYAPLLQQADSLLLTQDQTAAVRALAAKHKTQMDSIYADVAKWLVALPDIYDISAAVQRNDGAQLSALEMTRLQVREELPKILNPVQLTQLPGLTNYFYQATQQLRERFFIP
jgi:hypothetical protein